MIGWEGVVAAVLWAGIVSYISYRIGRLHGINAAHRCIDEMR